MDLKINRTSTNRRAQFLLLVLALLFSCGIAPLAVARSSGVVGATIRDGGSGCAVGCHAAANGTVTVTTGGPTSLAPGQTGNYTVTNNYSANTLNLPAGVNIATDDGVLTPSGNLSSNGLTEMRHFTPNLTNSSGDTVFSFSWTMPGAAVTGSAHTMYATGRVWISGNWNHAANFGITTAAPLSALVNGSATPGSIGVGGTGALSSSGGAGSGAVSFVPSNSGICSVSGTTVTAVSVGTCTITANKAADTTTSALSDAVSFSVVQGAQTITFAPVAPKLASAPPFVVSATGGGSGNPVTFAASGVCTNSGATITITGAVGTCTVTANQAGNANYLAAPTATLNISVVASGEVFPPNCQIPLGWVTSPGAMTGWDVATDQVATGACSLKSNVLPDSGTNLSARIQFTGTFLAGNVTFSRRVSTEANYDCLRFLVDGVEQGLGGTCPNLGIYVPGVLIGASGELPYATITVPIAAGSHTLIWSYDKDTVCCDGGSLDAVWIDNVTLPLAPPVITSASTATGAVGVAFSYSITASNSPWGYTATGLPPGLTVDTNGLISGTPTQVGTYTAMATATSGAGSTTTAIAFTINKGPQTIPFAPINNKPVATVAFTLPAIVGGGSGNPVTYTVSGVCTNFLSTVAYSTLGTCSVTANQLGNANYLDATPVTQSFLVFDPAVEYFPANCSTPAGWVVPGGLGWSPALDSAATGGCSLRANLDSSGSPAVIQYTGTFATGNITFARRVAAGSINFFGLIESCFRFYIDGVAQNIGGGICDGALGQGGFIPFGTVSVPILAGVHTISWQSIPRSFFFPLQADAWIDDVVLPQTSLTVTKAGGGTGTISTTPSGISNCGGTCSAFFTAGSVVTVTPNPSAGSYLSSWSGACTGSGACNVTMSVSRSVTGTFSLITAPGVPTGVAAAPANGGASISFTAPAFNGGSPITSYRATCGSTFATGPASPIIVPGLTNGVAVNCTVSASNAFASSLESSPPVSVTPRTVPGAPTGVSALAGNLQATVSFTAPLSNGGSAITGYTATCGIRTATGAGSPIVVTGLVNGATVNCAVVATNIAGNSASSASVPVTPRTVPSAPTLPVATAYDSRAIVDFVPSSSDGGSPITGYTVSCNPGAVTANGATSPITINGLTNGTSYTCAVLANNAAGSTASTSFALVPAVKTGTALWNGICASCHTPVPSGAQLNAAGPSPAVINYVIANPPMGGNPLLIALTPAERAQIIAYIAAQLPGAAETIAFNVPKSINVGNRITTGGVAFDRVEAGATLPLHGTLSAFTGTTATYTPAAGYVGTDTFTVVGAHDGTPAFLGSEIVINVNVLPPLSPVITSATTASGANGVAFNYQILASNAPTSFGTSVLPSGLTVSPLTGAITGTPTVGGSFSVTISATNAGGSGSATLTINLGAANQSIAFPAQSILTRPYSAAPTNTFAITPLATATSGLPVAYRSLTTGVCTVGGTTVTMLSAGNCRIAANQSGNASFNVAAEVTQDVTITAVVPGAPAIGAATPGNLQATIAFGAPADSGGSAITGYTATCAPSGTGSNMLSPIVVGGLINGTTYTCSVRASNIAGSGPASGTVMVTPVPTPTAPTITSANATTFTVTAAGSFNVIASGNPTPTTSLTGALPSGVAFNAGVLSGTPALGTVGAYAVTINAANGTLPNAAQAFTLTVAKTTQTISFTGPGTQNFSASSVPLSATSSAGLTVAFISNTLGVCTISGANAVLANVGTCNITALQSGDTNYNAATGVSQSFSVVQGAQTITFGAQVSPRAYVAGGTFGLAPLASASSLLAVAYSSLTPSVCTIGGTTVSILRAGQCTIAADQSGNGNVGAAAQVSQTITSTASVPGAPTIGSATAGDGKAFVGFTAPANDGGSAITTYTATCGGITGSGSTSPVTVNGLANGVATSCSVTATNATGTGAASASVGVTPNPLPGAAIWAATCGNGGCHGIPPVGTRLNVGGSTSAVLDYVIPRQASMSSNPALTGMSMSDRIAVAEYVRDFIPAVNASTPMNTAVGINVIGQIFINTPITAFTSLQVVAVPTNGTLSAFSGTTVTYTPNPGFVGTDTFTYRGTQAGLSGDPRTVTVTVSQGAPVVTSAIVASGVINQPFSYQVIASNAPTGYAATGLPATLTINPTTGLISGTPLTSGTINATISATNAGGTGSGPLTITINLIAQTISFGAQTSPQTFSTGGSFPVAPLATGGASGNPVTYSSTTPAVCNVTGTTVSMLTAGVCTIAADQAGNASYNAAARVTQNVTINPVVPSAPTIGGATPGDGQATVAFTAPAFNGGAAITSYTLRCIGPSTVVVSGGASPLTASGMTNGAVYACRVFATNTAGNSVDSAAVNVTPSALPPLALASVVSRKVHGTAGTYGVAINSATLIGGTVDVEPRAIGTGHTLVFTFNNPVTAEGSVAATDSAGAPVGTVSSTRLGNDVIVTLSDIADNKRVTVTLTSVNGTIAPFAASLGFLIGDVNNSRAVNSSDISGVKARSAQAINASNFLFDVNVNGSITSSDISAVKARSGVMLAP